MKKSLIPLILILASLTLAACGGPKAEPTSIPTVPAEYAGKSGTGSAAAGKEIYTLNCEACHGAAGHGDGPAGVALNPPPRNLPELIPQVGDDYLFWRVSTGVQGTSMVAWAGVLTEQQIWDVIAYVRTLK